MKKVSLTLTYSELCGLYSYIVILLGQGAALSRESMYYELQLSILAEVAIKKLYPKTALNTGKGITMQLKDSEAKAIQLTMLSGWNSLVPDVYTQSLVRAIVGRLPSIPIRNQQQLLPPDFWEEE